MYFGKKKIKNSVDGLQAANKQKGRFRQFESVHFCR